MTLPEQMPSEKARILVVEDEALVAMLIEDTLISLGYEVIGPASNVTDALALLEKEQVDGGLLDVNLGGGERSYPVAERLADKRTPFMFVTGYGISGIDKRFAAVPVLQKPFITNELHRQLAELLRSGSPLTQATRASSGGDFSHARIASLFIGRPK